MPFLTIFSIILRSCVAFTGVVHLPEPMYGPAILQGDKNPEVPEESKAIFYAQAVWYPLLTSSTLFLPDSILCV